MPELPEVETVMRGLSAALTGRTILQALVRRPNLRFPFPARFAARLAGQRFQGFTRRAKYILAELASGEVLLIHLGMSGRISIVPAAGRMASLGEFYDDQPASAGEGAHDHVVLELDDGARMIYTDPRRFGAMDLFPAGHTAEHRLLANIGVEPLGNGFHAAFLSQEFAGKKAPIKAALLDQSIIAGLGNIYVCEALHRAGIAPETPAGAIKSARLEALVRHIRDILDEAIRAGGSTLRDHAQTDGSAGAFQQRFLVYDREGEPCARAGCKGVVARLVQSNRSTFHCPKCQR